MQIVATGHSSAITGSSGCAELVTAALNREVAWSAENLKTMITALESHEADTGMAFTSIDPASMPEKLQAADGLLHHAFGARPPFNPGALVFPPTVIGPELGESAESLLAKFTATNDAAIAEAVAYWSTVNARMAELAAALAESAGRLLSENEGAAFTAAAASLTGLAGRVTSVGTSAGILITHLNVLPAVKAMAINTLSSIESQSATITDVAAKEAFERAEIAAFLAGPYLAQLETAVPTIPNLTQPDLSATPGGVVSAGVNGGHGIAGASQAGLAPAGLAAAATAPASAAAPAVPATSGPITGPNMMGNSPVTAPGSGGAGTPATPYPGSPAIAGPATMTPAAAPAPATVGAGTHGAGAGSRGPNVMGTAAAMGGTGSGAAQATGPGSGYAAGLAGMGATGGHAGAGRPVAGGASGPVRGRAGTPPGTTGRGSAAGGPASATHHGTKGSPSAAATRAQRMSGGSGGAGLASQSTRRKPGEAHVEAIRAGGTDFEQDEYQRELFGAEPMTVPAIIGANVRGRPA